MRSGADSNRRRSAGSAGLALLACFAVCASDAVAMELGELLRGMASAPGVHSRFHETREVALLSAPIESEGEIYFVPPRRFARFTTQPAFSHFGVDGDRVFFRDDTGARGMNASASRTARAVVDNFMVLFNGDAAGLESRYEMEFSSEGRRWRLRLRPRDAGVASVVAQVSLSGEGEQLLEMTLEEPNGDRSVTRFRDVHVGRLSDAELGRAFGSPTVP